MAMNSWYPSRRDFLKQTSAFALTSGVVLRQAVAQTAGDPKFVTAETAFGRIRGVDENGVKIFKGVPTEPTPQAAIGLCPPWIRRNGRA